MSSTEECELIVADLMDHLQGVEGMAVVERGAHKIPDLSQFPAIVLIDGDDNVTETVRGRGNKRNWDMFFALFVQGDDADDELPALAVFREAFRESMKEIRALPKPRNGVVYEAGRGMPLDAEMGNYVVVQTMAYKIIYAEPA